MLTFTEYLKEGYEKDEVLCATITGCIKAVNIAVGASGGPGCAER